MSTFATVLWKDLRVRFSSRAELVFFIVLPVVFIAVLSGTMGTSPTLGERAPLVLVYDTVHSGPSSGMFSALAAVPGLQAREVDDPTELIEKADADLLLWLTPSTTTDKPFTVTVRLSPWRSSAAQSAKRVEAALGGARVEAGGSDARSGTGPRPPSSAGVPSDAADANAG
ncbi:MAG TPA: hypothetical protein VFH83_07280, partial [Spirochaetia bacterium]|nr:hypothetical protein [Spirochaetia bacterium]